MASAWPPPPAPPGRPRPLRVLLGLWSHDAREAPDGTSALEAAAAFRPRVVLTSLGLPRLDDYEVARRLRQTPGLEGLLLVAVTGHGREADVARAREAGLTRCRSKPADRTALQRLLLSRPFPAGG